MKKSKLVLVALIGLLLAGGLVFLACNEEDDASCCPTFNEGTDLESFFDNLPKCCTDAFTRVDAYYDEDGDLIDGTTEAQLKAAAGCCWDSFKDFFQED